MKKFYKQKNKKYIKIFILVLLVILVLFIPLILALFLDLELFNFAPGDVASWIGFWGGYLGGVVGMLAVISTTIYIVNKQSTQNEEKIQLQQEQFEEQLKLQREHFEMQLRNQAESLKITDKNERKRIYLEIMINESNNIIGLLNKIALLSNDYFISIKDLYLACYKAQYEEHIAMQFQELSVREYNLLLQLSELLSMFYSKVSFIEDSSNLKDTEFIYKESKEFKNRIDDHIIDLHHEFKRFDGLENKDEEIMKRKRIETDKLAEKVVKEIGIESNKYKDYLVELIIKLQE